MNAMLLAAGLGEWPGPLSEGVTNGCLQHGIAPSSFLVENFDLLPRGLALDLAMGDGRNGIYLATRGYDPDFGARPIARLIQTELKDPIADQVLFGSLQRGGTVRVGVEGDALALACEGRS